MRKENLAGLSSYNLSNNPFTFPRLERVPNPTANAVLANAAVAIHHNVMMATGKKELSWRLAGEN